MAASDFSTAITFTTFLPAVPDAIDIAIAPDPEPRSIKLTGSAKV